MIKIKKIVALLATCLTLLSSTVFASGNINLTFSRTPIVEALVGLGQQANKNIIINGDLSGTVSSSLNNVSFEEALRMISMTHGFTYIEDGNNVIISNSDNLKTVATTQLTYLDLNAAKDKLKILFDEDDISINRDDSSISYSGSSAQIAEAQRILKEADVSQPQIMIKTTIIELSKSKSRDMGFTYASDPWGKDTSVSGYDGFKFLVTAQHQETWGKGNIIGRPTVTVLNGRNASILMGDEVPTFTTTSSSTDTSSDTTMSVEYKKVGVEMNVTPRINDPILKTITMDIKPKISSITEWVESGNNLAPQISTREAQTILRVKSGETILLGGLLKEEIINNTTGIPLLSKIPFLGELFKSHSKKKDKTEIIIALTPTIVENDEVGRPMVETQETTPALQDKLHELQSEEVRKNVSKEEHNNLENNNKELESKVAEHEQIIKEKDEQLDSTKKALKDKEKLIERLTKEIKENNELMKKLSERR